MGHLRPDPLSGEDDSRRCLGKWEALTLEMWLHRHWSG
jgi:hypothetical protein